jgi:predicted RNA-binding Zn-ribbon protein involved in translation (DUF1610 family)
MPITHNKKKIVSCSCGKNCLFKIYDDNLIEIKCPKCGEFVYYEIKKKLTNNNLTSIMLIKGQLPIK